MFEILKKHKSRFLLTLNKFVIRKGVTFEEVKKYNDLLARRPKREHFIPFDDEGTFIKNHKPLFKGWRVCGDTSDEKSKVAILTTQGNTFRIYFGTANGVEIMSLSHAADNCTYNDIAIFFEGHLSIN